MHSRSRVFGTRFAFLPIKSSPESRIAQSRMVLAPTSVCDLDTVEGERPASKRAACGYDLRVSSAYLEVSCA